MFEKKAILNDFKTLGAFSDKGFKNISELVRKAVINNDTKLLADAEDKSAKLLAVLTKVKLRMGSKSFNNPVTSTSLDELMKKIDIDSTNAFKHLGQDGQEKSQKRIKELYTKHLAKMLESDRKISKGELFDQPVKSHLSKVLWSLGAGMAVGGAGGYLLARDKNDEDKNI